MRIFLLVILIIFSGCNITKKANSSSTLKKIPTKRIIENVEKNKSDFSYLLLRSQATVTENGSKSQKWVETGPYGSLWLFLRWIGVKSRSGFNGTPPRPQNAIFLIFLGPWALGPGPLGP